MASKKRSFRRAVPPRTTPVFRDRYLDLSGDGRAPDDPAARANGSTDADHSALTEKINDQVIELSITFKAYVALERLISPDYEDEAQARVPLSREELGALLYTLNAAMLRQIRELEETTAALQARAI